MCDCKKMDYVHSSHKASYTFHWGFGNSKLEKEGIVSFNLPAFRSEGGFTVCPNASTCAVVCYARQGRYSTGPVKRVREHNLEWLQTHNTFEFVAAATQDIFNLHHSWVRIRIHDSGDFYNTNYFLAWLEIARQCRHLEFYGYTKMISLLNSHRHLLPDNLHLIQSVGGLEDALIDTRYAHAVIFPSNYALALSGYVDGTVTDSPAYTRAKNIGLVYHGVKHLTTHTAQLLSKKAKGVIHG